MISIIKYGALILVVMILITAGVLFYSNKNESDMKNITAKKPHSIEEASEQYNVSFSFNGNRSQIIDLIKGKAELNLVYTGSSKFTANLLYADGTLLVNLADQNGPYNDKQYVMIPETGAYLLDIKTIGEWSLNKE